MVRETKEKGPYAIYSGKKGQNHSFVFTLSDEGI